MTPEEKARELVGKFRELPQVDGALDNSKQCALIAVEEIIDALNEADNWGDKYDFYIKVEQEIEKI